MIFVAPVCKVGRHCDLFEVIMFEHFTKSFGYSCSKEPYGTSSNDENILAFNLNLLYSIVSHT